MLYVLDEPSIGLHQRDNARLLDTLRRLRDLGNTVIVVEHDEDAILAADHVVDVGPGAGIHGGEIVAEGTPAEIMANPEIADRPISLRRARRSRRRARGASRQPARKLKIVGARGNNLKNVTADDSARPVHLRHRRLGRRQIDAGRSIRSTRRRRAGSTAPPNIPRRSSASKASNISTR